MARLWLVAPIVALAYLVLAWSSVAALLARDARARSEAWTTPHATPWQWSLQHPDAVVWPGSRGFERDPDRSDALVGTVPDGTADLSLALRGERIDPSLVSGAILGLQTQQDVRVVLLGTNDMGTIDLGESTAAAPDLSLSLPFHSSTPDSLHALRLRVETSAGERLLLRGLTLTRSSDVRVAACDASENLSDMLAACATRVPLLAAPLLIRPEALLAWRDRVLLERPAAIVRANDSLPAWTGLTEALRQRQHGWTFWVLGTLPLLGLLLNRVFPRPGARRALLELTLTCGPWALLLWCGWPADDPAPAPTWTFLACLLGALLLRDPTPDWVLVGTRRAWLASAKVTVLALSLLLLAGIANALDADGLVMRVVPGEDLARYPAWALLQQLILIRTIAPRMRIAFGSDASAALAAGALFGLLHLPNFSLMLLTFAAGTAWAWLGNCHRALLPLVVSHAVLGLTLMILAPSWLLRSAEIGGRYLMTP